HPVTNQAKFMEKIAYYGLRSTVRPGVTGWAQIRYGYANNLAEETEKMRYDLFYIKNRSVWLDLRILLMTVATVLLGAGASEVHRRRAPLRPALHWQPVRRVALAPTGTDGPSVSLITLQSRGGSRTARPAGNAPRARSRERPRHSWPRSTAATPRSMRLW